MTDLSFILARTILTHVIFQRPSVQQQANGWTRTTKKRNEKLGKRMEPLATHPMASTTPATTMASLNATRMLAKWVKKYLVFKSGTEATESLVVLEKELFEATSKVYQSHIDKLDFHSNKMTTIFGPLSPGFLEDKALEVLCTAATPSALYGLFKNLKSEFWNRWTPFVEFRSGETEADMLRRVHQKVWAERKNSDNRRKGRPQNATPDQCPESFVPLEIETFVAFKDHHTLKKESLSLQDTEETVANTSRATTKRPMSRAEQRSLKKKKVSATESITDTDVKKGLAIADRHNEMMQLQADVQIAMLYKNIDPEYFKQLTDNIRERCDKLQMENKKKNAINNSNSSNSMDNSSSDNED